QVVRREFGFRDWGAPFPRQDRLFGGGPHLRLEVGSETTGVVVVPPALARCVRRCDPPVVAGELVEQEQKGGNVGGRDGLGQEPPELREVSDAGVCHHISQYSRTLP